VNGLVYFDQVSLLPASHLLLVTVGIFILLGGVWAVSFLAVNGMWSGGDDVDASLIEDGITDESSLPDSNPTPASPATEMPGRERARSHTIASETAISSPPPSPRISRRRSHNHHPSQTLSGIVVPVSPPSAPVPAPIFSIGLSPMSPGFALVPRERRRCVSGQSGGDAWEDVIRGARTRQSASDGYAVTGDEVERGGEEGAIGEDERETGSNVGRARARWKRVRTLILGQ
jgi:magnesium transporter